MKPIISALAIIIALFGSDFVAMGQSIKVGVVTPLTDVTSLSRRLTPAAGSK